MKTVTGTAAFITGGASGIGFGMAQVLAAAGAKIMIADINAEGAAMAAESIRKDGGQASAVHLNVSEPESWEEAMRYAAAEFGPIHILCNNAGVAGSIDMGLEEISEPAWNWCRSTNLDGIVNGVRAFVPRAKAHGQPAHIVNTGSMASFFAFPKMGDYTITKFGIRAVTEVLRQELAGYDIGVSLLCPAGTKTALIENSQRLYASDPRTSSIGRRQSPAAAAQIRKGMEPGILGALVLRAILENRANIFTHPELRSRVEAEFQDVMDDFSWAARTMEMLSRNRG